MPKKKSVSLHDNIYETFRYVTEVKQQLRQNQKIISNPIYSKRR